MHIADDFISGFDNYNMPKRSSHHIVRDCTQQLPDKLVPTRHMEGIGGVLASRTPRMA